MALFKRAFLWIVLALLWTGFVFISAFYGLWMRPIAQQGNSREFFDSTAQVLEEANQGNAVLVMIESGKIFDQVFSKDNAQVNAQTLFPTASMSKWVTAVGVMKLVEQGNLDLDAPIASYLKQWQLPESQFDDHAVTIRRLLSHTAGLTDGLGFADYAASETLPTTVESLRKPRASGGEIAEIVVGLEPGSEWKYSGGGYLILQLILEEVTGKPFAQFIRDELFNPLRMQRSNYGFIGAFENQAGSCFADGNPAPVYQYACAAATGLNATSGDMVRFVLAQIPESGVSQILKKATHRSMRQSQARKLGADIWGLGAMLYAPTARGDFIYGHDGANSPAINCAVRINPDNGDAIIVLQTGHPTLATQIGSEWVLWQTGIPDVFALDSVIESMVVPVISGWIVCFLVFLTLTVLFWRRTKKRYVGEHCSG